MQVILCFQCHGSGWKDKQVITLGKLKESFILLPCKDCKGTGLIEFKTDIPDQEKKEEK